jgi:hypothetical protein
MGKALQQAHWAKSLQNSAGFGAYKTLVWQARSEVYGPLEDTRPACLGGTRLQLIQAPEDHTAHGVIKVRNERL